MTARSADRSGTFGGSTPEPTVPPGRRSRTRTRFEIGGSITEGRFTADWEGRDSGETPTEDSVRGFTGTMLGEFYGSAGEEVGGALRGHRDATASTPEQILNGFFSAGR